MNEKEMKIFVDFDGTITSRDVGDALFSHFGNKEKVDGIIRALLSDEISAKQCWLDLCKATGNIDQKEMDEFIDAIEIDHGFQEFAEYCRKYNIDFYVLSDGFDYYINRILKRENLEWVKFYANHIELTSEGKLIPQFPHEDHGCTTSANCKRNHIVNHSSDTDFTVYIGDGNSDKYTAQYCDFIFAKDDLLKFCEKERITFFAYKDFTDVTKRLEQLRTKKRLKKRHQAELKRRELYMIE